MQWSSITCLTLLIGCVEGLSKISVRVFHDRMQRLVIEFIPYFTLLKGFMYKLSELLSLVGLMCISLHFWKKFSNDLGSFPFRNEWTRTQFWVLTISLILRIFHFLNKGDDYDSLDLYIYVCIQVNSSCNNHADARVKSATCGIRIYTLYILDRCYSFQDDNQRGCLLCCLHVPNVTTGPE